MEQDRTAEIRNLIEQDDPMALAVIYDCWADSLYRYLISFFGDSDTAGDILQRVFLRIAEKRKSILTADDIERYIFIMTRNEAISFQRKTKRRKEVHADLHNCLVFEGDNAAPENFDSRQLTAALDTLPPDQREIIVLKIYEEKSFREIAEMLGISPNTAASRYRYGIEKMRKLIEESD